MTSIRDSRRRGVALTAVVLLVAACTGGSGTPTAQPGTPTAQPGTPTAPPAATTIPTSAAVPTAAPARTPSATVIDGTAVTTFSLGPNTAPIDVVAGFGSLWVADHHAHAVSRIDPVTLAEIARIQVGSGPGWFAVTEDAVWVNSQLGRGLTRIDPTANTADIRAGDWATCGGPVVADGAIWQMACDAGVIMRIDLATNTSTDIYASGYLGVGLTRDGIVAAGPQAISRVDRDSGELEKVGDGAAGFPVAFDDQSVWFASDTDIRRIAIADGSALPTIPVGGELTVTVAGGRAWVTQFGLALHDVEIATGRVARTLHLHKPSVARELDGVLWVTSFDANSLSFLEP